MHFNIIKLSESHANWNDKDYEYVGVIPGYHAGFNFETRNTETGEIDYMSCMYLAMDPDCIDESYLFSGLYLSNHEPTGRAIFRGYGREEYDEDGEYYIDECHDEAIKAWRGHKNMPTVDGSPINQKLIRSNLTVFEFSGHFENDDAVQYRYVVAETEVEAIEKFEAYVEQLKRDGFATFIHDGEPLVEIEDVIV